MELINSKEAARRLNVSLRRVQQLITEGKLAAKKVGRDYVIYATDLKYVEIYGKPGRPPKKGKDK